MKCDVPHPEHIVLSQFDPTLKKKKKKKKTPFDLDAAMDEGEKGAAEDEGAEAKEDAPIDDGKKKKKKAFNMDDVEDALPDKEEVYPS